MISEKDNSQNTLRVVHNYSDLVPDLPSILEPNIEQCTHDMSNQNCNYDLSSSYSYLPLIKCINTTFCGTTLIGSDFHKSYFKNVNFRDSDITDVIFCDSYFIKSNFTNSHLEHADFTDSFLYGVDFAFAKLYNANFRNAILNKVRFRNTDLSNVNFKGADLRGMVFTNSSWPFCPTSYDVKVDVDFASQFAYHFCRLDCDDPEYIAAKNAIAKFANKYECADKPIPIVEKPEL